MAIGKINKTVGEINTLLNAIENAPNIYTTPAQVEAQVAEAVAPLAEKDGSYPQMSVGFAENIVGDGTATEEEFLFRPTAGVNRNVESTTYDYDMRSNFGARIESVKGNSVVEDGEIVDAHYSAIKTTGFNQYNGTFAKVVGGCPYYLGSGVSSAGFTTEEGGTTEAIEIPTNRLYTPAQNGYIYAEGSDICINIAWDEYASLNGTYAPYKPFERDLSWVSQYFPEGMRRAGSVCDEIRFNSTTQKWEAVQRVGVVDLGTLPWNRHNFGDNTNPKYTFRGGSIAGGIAPATWTKANLLMPKYTLTIGGNVQNTNYSYGAEYVSATSPCYLKIRDDSYTDAATFKTAMQGVMLNYELATPIVTEIEGIPNLDFDVADYGTEELIAPEGVKSAPFHADIIYTPNALKTLEQVPDILRRLTALENA